MVCLSFLRPYLYAVPEFRLYSRIRVPSHFSSSDVVLLRQGEGSGVRYIRTQDPSAGGRILYAVAYGGKPTRPLRARRPGLARRTGANLGRLQILLDIDHKCDRRDAVGHHVLLAGTGGWEDVQENAVVARQQLRNHCLMTRTSFARITILL